jgi:GTP pyrophosphokinase
MHHTAELGIAAHWRYKAGETTPRDIDQQMSWLRQVIDMQQETTDPEEFLENLKTELFQDEIFVFTPKGDLQQFPKGATPIDFAFNVHTDIGLHCLSAKVNDHIVPLRSTLNSGDTVQIITSPHRSPSRSWLESVKTNKARQAIRRWFKDEEHAHSVHLGQEILNRELLRYPNASQQKDIEHLASELGLGESEQLYAALGSGDLSIGRVISHLFPHSPLKQSKTQHQDRRGICIQGMNNLMISFGKCCTPIPGDAVIGLVTRGRGVTVHRTHCPNMGHISEEPDRLLQVAWDLEGEQAFTVKLRVHSHDRKYLLADISKALGDSGCNIQSATTRTRDGTAQQDFLIEVANIVQLRQAMKSTNSIKGVLGVQRIDELGGDLALAPPA